MTPWSRDDEMAALVVQFDGTGPADPDFAIAFCDELAAWLTTDEAAGTEESPGDQRRKADLWFMQGMLRHRRGDLEGALALLQRSIDCSRHVDYQRREALALRSLAICYEDTGMQADSTRCIFEALDLAAALDDDLTLALVSHALTALYQAQGAYGQMLESGMRTCAIAQQAGDTNLLNRVYCSVAVALGRLGRSEEGFAWLDRAGGLPVDDTQPLVSIYLVLNRMLLLRFADRMEEAAALADQQTDIIARIPSTDAARLAVFIADTYIESGRLDEAERMLDRAAVAARSEQMTAHLIEYYATSAQLHEARGDAGRAVEMLRQYVKLEREIRGLEAQARLVAVERRFAAELAAKNHELHQLRTVELVEKNRQLSDLVHQKEAILHVVAHDLRNPLAAAQLLGESLILDLRDSVDANAIERLEFIRVAATEMRGTIDTLVASASIEAQSNPAPASTAVRQAVAKAERRSAERGVSIDHAITDVELMVDSALLRRSLDDVLWNAIGDSVPGSEVRVRVEPTEPGARITVRGGIRLDQNLSPQRSLYIARRLVERMNGTITLSLTQDQRRHVATIDLRG